MKLTANVSNWTWFTQMVGFNENKNRFVTFRRRKKLLSFADMYSYDYLKKCCGNLLFCFWLRFQNNARSLHHLQFLQIFFLFLVSPNYFHNRRMLKKMNTISISILLNLNLKMIFDGHWQGSFVVCIPSQADALVLVTINHY